MNLPRPVPLTATLLAFALAPFARADAVTDWNAVLDTVVARYGGPQQQSRAQAIVQIAVHDALNSIKLNQNRAPQA